MIGADVVTASVVTIAAVIETIATVETGIGTGRGHFSSEHSCRLLMFLYPETVFKAQN